LPTRPEGRPGWPNKIEGDDELAHNKISASQIQYNGVTNNVVFHGIGGVVLGVVSFPELVQGLLDCGLDVVIPTREAEDTPRYNVIFTYEGSQVHSSVHEGIMINAMRDAMDALAATHGPDQDHTLIYDAVKAVPAGRQDGDVVKSGTQAFLLDWSNRKLEAKEEELCLPAHTKPIPEFEKIIPKEQIVQLPEKQGGGIVLVQGAFPTPALEVEVIPQPISASPNSKADRIKICEAMGEECKYCGKLPDSCDAVFQPPDI
jgi:hypothetical protein